MKLNKDDIYYLINKSLDECKNDWKLSNKYYKYFEVENKTIDISIKIWYGLLFDIDVYTGIDSRFSRIEVKLSFIQRYKLKRKLTKMFKPKSKTYNINLPKDLEREIKLRNIKS